MPKITLDIVYPKLQLEHGCSLSNKDVFLPYKENLSQNGDLHLLARGMVFKQRQIASLIKAKWLVSSKLEMWGKHI